MSFLRPEGRLPAAVRQAGELPRRWRRLPLPYRLSWMWRSGGPVRAPGWGALGLGLGCLYMGSGLQIVHGAWGRGLDSLAGRLVLAYAGQRAWMPPPVAAPCQGLGALAVGAAVGCADCWSVGLVLLCVVVPLCQSGLVSGGVGVGVVEYLPLGLFLLVQGWGRSCNLGGLTCHRFRPKGCRQTLRPRLVLTHHCTAVPPDGTPFYAAAPRPSLAALLSDKHPSQAKRTAVYSRATVRNSLCRSPALLSLIHSPANQAPRFATTIRTPSHRTLRAAYLIFPSNCTLVSITRGLHPQHLPAEVVPVTAVQLCSCPKLKRPTVGAAARRAPAWPRRCGRRVRGRAPAHRAGGKKEGANERTRHEATPPGPTVALTFNWGAGESMPSFAPCLVHPSDPSTHVISLHGFMPCLQTN